MQGAIDDPVINEPYDPPARHFEIGPTGPTGQVLDGRRTSESWIPVPAARKGKGRANEQITFDFDVTGERREQNTLINDIRREVERWRLTYEGVTPITRKLLEHWGDPARGDERVLFCQREAVETAIWLAEVALRRRGTVGWRGRIDEANVVHNAGLPRVALKMATGSGKTVVMAMLIAWQTLNHAYNPHDARYTDRFLVVTPGITIRDRLRVLLPNDDENYYRLRDLVPADLWPNLSTARVSITNYHTFLPRDHPEIRGVASRTRQILTQGKADLTPPVPPSLAVWRSVRTSGDTKTRRSRRTLALPARCVDVLSEHRRIQARLRVAAGTKWIDLGLVFTTRWGTPLDSADVRRDFRAAIGRARGIDADDWTPRELRHSFVSLLSDSGVPIEEISRLVGHKSTLVTEVVYRKQLRPVIQAGATVMDQLFASRGNQSGNQDAPDTREPGSLAGEPGSDQGV